MKVIQNKGSSKSGWFEILLDETGIGILHVRVYLPLQQAYMYLHHHSLISPVVADHHVTRYLHACLGLFIL